MENSIKIIVVEDDMVIASKITLLLANLGYTVNGIFSCGEEAVQHARDFEVDIILLDINLKGKLDGIGTAMQAQTFTNALVIYLTDNSDEATFNRAKSTRPVGFITKPFSELDLQSSIEKALCKKAEYHPKIDPPIRSAETQQFILGDRIFIKCRDKLIKIMISDVLYIEADRNYSRIFTTGKEFLLSITLKSMEEKLPGNIFVRIHRSYCINITQIEEVGDSFVVIGGKPIPMSAGLKENLFQRLQTI